MNELENILALARPSIVSMNPYNHACFDPSYERLHANESPWPPATEDSNSALNHYPEPQPKELVTALAHYYGVSETSILLGRGSDEGIELITRVFCESERDAVMICPPTFGMYAVAAHIQGAQVKSVPLVDVSEFKLNISGIKSEIKPNIKIFWLCTPNNPTGGDLDPQDINEIIELFRGRALVVIDEAYAEFSAQPSWIPLVAKNPHLIVLRTLSKAFGLAGARLGTVIAAPKIIALLRKIISPYAISRSTTTSCLKALKPAALAVMHERILLIIKERERLIAGIERLKIIKKIHKSDSNFILVESLEIKKIFTSLKKEGLLVRNVQGLFSFDGAIRITVGTIEQNNRLIKIIGML
ncbi:MAG: histidinol-phosphate transaminase [Gammaproteobacteria bacterium]|nr:histidinol-phosphate transaminase [Gammaproteobacteria bacterium]